MSALTAHDLRLALEAGEKMAALPSRESAKGFCRYAGDRMRDIFLFQQGLQELADSQAGAWADSCRKTFPRGALAALSRARQLIDRNVNQKLVFTDLVDRLYLNVI